MGDGCRQRVPFPARPEAGSKKIDGTATGGKIAAPHRHRSKKIWIVQNRRVDKSGQSYELHELIQTVREYEFRCSYVRWSFSEDSYIANSRLNLLRKLCGLSAEYANIQLRFFGHQRRGRKKRIRTVNWLEGKYQHAGIELAMMVRQPVELDFEWFTGRPRGLHAGQEKSEQHVVGKAEEGLHYDMPQARCEGWRVGWTVIARDIQLSTPTFTTVLGATGRYERMVRDSKLIQARELGEAFKKFRR
ncbi:hypothetical protein B0H17DRAFT_1133761 [Mycena rosella]|uniref:Uncharacterized protein n=1 Tax=Mycena rosella TaxID=1033263 RepID=A0AAD7DHD4_MYCRO|nr:hypothetical protein B0H17DRAFT_1133761 [Mycena rosella]